MNTYRFVLLGADANTPGAHIFCENKAAAFELALATAEGPLRYGVARTRSASTFQK